MKKYLILSLLITALSNAVTHDSVEKCFMPFSLDIQKSREIKETFFEKHPNAHATVYGLYHGLGGVGVVSSTVLVTAAAWVGITFALGDFDISKFERKWPFGVLPALGVGAAYGYCSFHYSEKILDAIWTTCRLPKPKNDDGIAEGSKVLGVAGAIVIPLGLLVKAEHRASQP